MTVCDLQPTAYSLLLNKLRHAFVLGHALHDVAEFPVLFLEPPAQQGDEDFHEHFAVVDRAVHLFGVDLHRDFSALHEQARHVAELVVREFGQDGLADGEAVDDRVAGDELGILGVGFAEEARVEVRVVGEQDGALAAERGEFLEAFAYRGRVFDHLVGDVVDAGGFGGNEHVRLDERLEFRNQFGDDLAVASLYGKLYRANFNDFVLYVAEAGGFEVKCYEFRR